MVSIVYVAFLGLIGFAIYFTHSLTPLICLLFFPSFNEEDKTNNEHKNNDK